MGTLTVLCRLGYWGWIYFSKMEEDCPLSRIAGVVVCKDCGHVGKDEERHKEHMMEPRHIHAFRNLAYREPKKRQLYLKIWYSSIEKIEEEDPWALAFDETEEYMLTPAEA